MKIAKRCALFPASRLVRVRTFLFGLLLIGVMASSAWADDSAASVATGGIVLRHEASISMEKEVLAISLAKVTVDYEFLNDTDKDITTVVAFPIPPYVTGPTTEPASFDDFRLWVDNKQIKYAVDAHAKLDGKDYTDFLRGLGIDFASFGGYDLSDSGQPTGPITKLPKQQLQQLAKMGLIDGYDSDGPGWPLWTVTKMYYWRQTFPAHRMVHIRHEYSPMVGFQDMSIGVFDPAQREQRSSELIYKNLDEACIDPGLQRALQLDMGKYNKNEDAAIEEWIDFILTTANSWKGPIKDFTLIVDRGPSPKYALKPDFVSFCWDGRIQKLDQTHFEAHAENFVPKKNLHIAFFTLPVPEQPKK